MTGKYRPESATLELMQASALLRPPGPPPRRGGVLGNLGYYWSFATDPIGFVAQRFERYGDIYFAPGPDGGLYVVKHPDHIADVLLSRGGDYRKTHTAFDRLSQVLGDGLVTTDGDLWKRHRRMIQPAFHKRELARYGEIAAGEAARTGSQWTIGRVYDMSREMMQLTLRIVCRSLFSHDVTSDTDAVATSMSAFQDSLIRPDILPGWVPSPARRRMRRAVDNLDQIMFSMIGERRNTAGAAPHDLLQMLLSAVDEEGVGDKLTEREVRDHLVTLFLAGHETTANALSWAWYLLSQNPNVEANLHDELDSVLGGRDPTFGDLSKLEITEQVIKEAMRLYPPVYMVARRAHADTQIGDYAVPAGSEIAVWIYMTHRDSRWYPEPEVFRPERFAPAAEAALPKMAYLPFGAGPRACIGKQFALIEAQLVLATLAQMFRFEAVNAEKVEPKPRITLIAKNGMRMRARAWS